jgi:hypothetical protein
MRTYTCAKAYRHHIHDTQFIHPHLPGVMPCAFTHQHANNSRKTATTYMLAQATACGLLVGLGGSTVMTPPPPPRPPPPPAAVAAELDECAGRLASHGCSAMWTALALDKLPHACAAAASEDDKSSPCVAVKDLPCFSPLSAPASSSVADQLNQVSAASCMRAAAAPAAPAECARMVVDE